MKTGNGYYGDKADVFSIGAILLELMLGHGTFCDYWMVAYEYETLMDVVLFSNAIKDAVFAMEEKLLPMAKSDTLLSFLHSMLDLNVDRACFPSRSYL